MSAQLSEPILIKRDAQSRRYDPACQRSVTVPQLQEGAEKGRPFLVLDAETGAGSTQILIA